MEAAVTRQCPFEQKKILMNISADPCLPGGARPEAVSQSKQHRTGLAMPCCFLVSRHGFSEAFSVLSPGFAGCDAQTRPNAIQGASRSQCDLQIEALSCKTLFFYGFWTQRLTLKITPTQVQKRSPWARQAMLFPCFAARLLGSFFGARSQCEVLEANARCKLKP